MKKERFSVCMLFSGYGTDGRVLFWCWMGFSTGKDGGGEERIEGRGEEGDRRYSGARWLSCA